MKMKRITRINGLTPEEYAAKSRERKLRKRAVKMDADVLVTPPPHVDTNFTEPRPKSVAPPDEHLIVPLTPQGSPVLKVMDVSGASSSPPEHLERPREVGPPIPRLNPHTMSTVES